MLNLSDIIYRHADYSVCLGGRDREVASAKRQTVGLCQRIIETTTEGLS